MRPGILQPGQTLGIIGGGQLGRMTAREARRSGYRTIVFTDEPNGSPAGQIADREINASYFDEEARDSFVKEADVVTMEFENIPGPFLKAIEPLVPVHPGRSALEICQNREREKKFLKTNGIPHAEFRVVKNAADLQAAVQSLGTPCVLKTADFGYDGKGQRKLTGGEDFEAVWKELGAPRGVVEQWVDFVMEISVVCARARDGAFVHFPACENIHAHHILDITIAPARIDPSLAAAAAELASAIASALQYTGTLAVEMFVTRQGGLLVNEMAPRPHNSGHHTIDACVTNQFQQQLRTVAGLPPGDPRQHTPAVMVNLLGDLWPAPDEHPDWSPVLLHPRAFLHLYGKRLAKPRRKMGHFTVLGETVDEALAQARELRRALGMES
ncbi:MAG TPA: 5-(carboxyamino)imidazole ribonucleotide synthase [Verrucomicrobiales bacterium]|jgi:5-(carboxyamino)imidazole ribonucleotide synthase|nr:5-(carboxyamino)imidazole ribonucleotide synthase [Verrucomicrobiales bacterium]